MVYNNTMTKDINLLLKLFVTDGSRNNDVFRSPFRIDDKVYATDRHVMVIVPAELALDAQPLENYNPENVLSIIPQHGNVLQTLQTKEILVALKSIPTIKEDKPCGACRGEGEVEFEYYFENIRYTADEDCPVCDGEGSFPDEDGKTIPDATKSVTVGKSNFSGRVLKQLYQLCKHFDFDEIDMVSQQSELGASLFSKGDISVLVMPLKDIESVYTIK